MNSSESKYMGDLLMLALVSPEMFNESAEYNSIPQESDLDYKDDMDTWNFMLQDAIKRNDTKQVSTLRKDIQRMKTEKRIKRRLITEQKSLKEIMQI